MWRSRFGLTCGRSCSVASIHGWLRNMARVWRAIATSASRQCAGSSGTSISRRDRVPHQLEQLVAAVEVVVERHRARAELLRDPPHRDRLEPFLVGDAQRDLRRSACATAASRRPRPRGSAAPRSAPWLLDIRTAYLYRTPYYDVHRTKPPHGAAVVTEGLGRRFGETEALSGLDLAVAAGHGARAARPQRRRQDDRRAHPHHAAGADQRPRVRQRPRRRRRARAPCASRSRSPASRPRSTSA